MQAVEYQKDFLLAAISQGRHGQEQSWLPMNEFDTAIVGAA
jgi:hypothetical protein